VGEKKVVSMDEVVPNKQLRKGIVAQEVTSDFVLEIYEKAKKTKSEKRRKEYLAIAEELSKHIGKYLVE